MHPSKGFIPGIVAICLSLSFPPAVQGINFQNEAEVEQYLASQQNELTITREYRLTQVPAKEVRIFLLGTFLAVPVHVVVFIVDDKTNTFKVTDTPDRLLQLDEVLPVLDQPLKASDTRGRLMEMWVRCVNEYRGGAHRIIRGTSQFKKPVPSNPGVPATPLGVPAPMPLPRVPMSSIEKESLDEMSGRSHVQGIPMSAYFSTFLLQGLLTDIHGDRIALFHSTGRSFILRRGVLYTSHGDPIPKVSGTINRKLVILRGPFGSTQEFAIKTIK